MPLDDLEPSREHPHVPGPSISPVGFAVGVVVLLVGLIISWWIAAVGALVAIALAFLYQWTVLVHYATFLRALSEVYFLGVLILLEDHRRNVLPVGLAWIEVWGYVALRARVAG